MPNDIITPAGKLPELWKDEALNLNLDGVNSCGVSVMYYTEEVD